MLKNDSQYNKEQNIKMLVFSIQQKSMQRYTSCRKSWKEKKKESRIRKKSNLKSQKQKDNINLCQKEISVRNSYFFIIILHIYLTWISEAGTTG